MNRLLLVDACNMLMRMKPYRVLVRTAGIEAGIERLLEAVRNLHDAEGIETHFVVDGRGPALTQKFPGAAKTLSIIHSPEHQTADTVIEGWLMRLGGDWEVTVATEDRAVAHTAIAHGAEAIRGEALLQWAERSAAGLARAQGKPSQTEPFGNSLETYFKNR